MKNIFILFRNDPKTGISEIIGVQTDPTSVRLFAKHLTESNESGRIEEWIPDCLINGKPKPIGTYINLEEFDNRERWPE